MAILLATRRASSLLSKLAAGFRPWEKCAGVFLSPFGQPIIIVRDPQHDRFGLGFLHIVREILPPSSYGSLVILAAIRHALIFVVVTFLDHRTPPCAFQTVCGGPSSSLSLAFNAPIRISASARVRFGLKGVKLVGVFRQPLEHCRLLGCHWPGVAHCRLVSSTNQGGGKRRRATTRLSSSRGGEVDRPPWRASQLRSQHSRRSLPTSRRTHSGRASSIAGDPAPSTASQVSR